MQEREFERLGEARSVHVDIRVIATTNVSLATMVERGHFRSDLYYRLNVIPLSLPPLRDRRGRHSDSGTALCARNMRRSCRPSLPRLHPEFPRSPAVAVLAGKRAGAGELHAAGAHLERDIGNRRGCFEMEFQGAARQPIASRVADAGRRSAAGTPIRQVERLHLENTLALTDGNRTHAAEMLGISLRTLRNKIREYGLPPRRYA